jgi:hypothetical protein
MSDSVSCHRKAAQFLRQAAEMANPVERGRLIDEALYWHNLALDAAGHRDGKLNDNSDQFGSEATG